MVRPTARTAFVTAVIFVALQPGFASAAVDLTGDYRVDGVSDFITDACTATIVQTGTTLSYDAVCTGGAAIHTATGTVDPVSGAFDLTGTCEVLDIPPVPPQGPYPFIFSGTGSQDSLSFTMTGECGSSDSVVIFGTKCGNGIADADELCEDGNRESGDCCSSTCEPETGNVCDAGGPECTVDQCDSSGTCVAAAVLAPAGASCDTDGDLCTEDLCDGAGTCSSTGGSVSCSLCEACEPSEGCKPNPSGGLYGNPLPSECWELGGPGAKGKIVNSLTDDAKDRFTWRSSKSYPFSAGDFGTPTTTTDYTLCVFDTLRDKVVGTLEIPAGSGWLPTPKGYKYKSAPGDTPRVKLQLDSGGRTSRIKVRVRGEELGFPDAFVGEDLRRAQIELRASNGKCWSSRRMKRGPFNTTPSGQKIKLKFERSR